MKNNNLKSTWTKEERELGEIMNRELLEELFWKIQPLIEKLNILVTKMAELIEFYNKKERSK